MEHEYLYRVTIGIFIGTTRLLALYASGDMKRALHAPMVSKTTHK